MRVKSFIIALGPVVVLVLLVAGLHTYYLRSLEQSYDFGVVLGEYDLKHTLSIPNYSTETLTIVNVQPSCGCTVIDEFPKLVTPLQTFRLPVRMDVSKKSGHATSDILVQFSNGRTAIFRMTAMVYPPLPDTVHLGKVKGNSVISRSYALERSTSSLLTDCAEEPLTGVKLSYSNLRNRAIVHIRLEPELRDAGDFRLEFPLLCVEGDRRSIVIKGEVAGPIEPDRPLFSLGYLKNSELQPGSQRGEVSFHSPYGNRFHWVDVDTKRSSSIRLTKLDDDGERIQFELLPPLEKGVFEETIPFVFEVSGQDSVTVPVTVYAYITSDSNDSKEPMGHAQNAS